jgi:RND family efflux transporter MFP subunit
MGFFASILAFFGLGGPAAHPAPPPPPQTYLVAPTMVADEKPVFATVESVKVVPARTRIGGTIIELLVKQGDRVEQGQLIATIGDPKLALQVNAYSAQVQAAQAQLAQAELEYQRAQRLIAANAIAKNTFDQARTAYSVAASNVRSLNAQRAVVHQQSVEGQVLAPTAGRVITVPVTSGTVLLSGDTVATVAEQNFVMRLQIPERHARTIKAGDPIRLDGGDVGSNGPRFGKIQLVYPQIDNGHVVADATVDGVGDYFVGERVRVWVSAGQRRALVVPARLVVTRSGIDYVRLRLSSGAAIDVPVQRGREIRTPRHDAIEILSGLTPGDRLLKP